MNIIFSHKNRNYGIVNQKSQSVLSWYYWTYMLDWISLIKRWKNRYFPSNFFELELTDQFWRKQSCQKNFLLNFFHKFLFGFYDSDSLLILSLSCSTFTEGKLWHFLSMAKCIITLKMTFPSSNLFSFDGIREVSINSFYNCVLRI